MIPYATYKINTNVQLIYAQILSAAMTDRVNSNSLQRKGIRLSASQLYKSKFLDIKKEPVTVGFQLDWQKNSHDYQYNVHLTVPTDT